MATRTVTDLRGRVAEIPADPQRVVVLDSNRVVSTSVGLGSTVAGATTNPTNGGNGFSPFLGPAGVEITDVGPNGHADVEQIAALAPDLILFAAPGQEELRVDTPVGDRSGDHLGPAARSARPAPLAR